MMKWKITLIILGIMLVGGIIAMIFKPSLITKNLSPLFASGKQSPSQITNNGITINYNLLSTNCDVTQCTSIFNITYNGTSAPSSIAISNPSRFVNLSFIWLTDPSRLQGNMTLFGYNQTFNITVQNGSTTIAGGNTTVSFLFSNSTNIWYTIISANQTNTTIPLSQVVSFANGTNGWFIPNMTIATYTNVTQNQMIYNSTVFPVLNKNQEYKIMVIGNMKATTGSMSVDFIPTLNISGFNFTLLQLAWWNTSWNYTRPITVNTTVASNLNNFPILATVSTSDLINSGFMNSSCKDLRIVDTTNTTVLPYEIYNGTCNSTKTVIRFTNSTLASGNNTFWMYYGNPSANDSQNVSGVYTAFVYINHHYANGSITLPSGYSMTSGANVSFVSTNSGINSSNSTKYNGGGGATGQGISSTNWYSNNTNTFTINVTNGYYLSMRFNTTNQSSSKVTIYPYTFFGGAASWFLEIARCGNDSGTRCVSTNTNFWEVWNSNLNSTRIYMQFKQATSNGTWQMLQVTGNPTDNRSYLYQNGSITNSLVTNMNGSTGRFTYAVNPNFGATGVGSAQSVWGGYQQDTMIGQFNASNDYAMADFGQLYWVGSQITNSSSASNCWTKSGNLLIIPSGCMYVQSSGTIGQT